MSTGPENYRDADTYIDAASDAYVEGDMETCKIKLQFAQVHVTLALVAATIDSGGASWNDTSAVWAEVIR